ncbi:MAG: hypothetical protein WAK17_19005 [Candidatus Nitrosopolaris sp.]
MSLLEEGMVLGVKNFKTKLDQNNNSSNERFTLLAASRIWPDHYGLRAISEHTYYPMQFEVIEQSVDEWGTDDQSTMMIQISAIPVNYNLVINGDSNHRVSSSNYGYIRGFSYPLIGDGAYVLSANTVSEMYNRRVLDKMHWQFRETSPEAKKDPRIWIIKMFEY